MFSIPAIHSNDTLWSHHLFVGEAQDRAEGNNGVREQELDEASRTGRRARLAWLSGDL